MATSDKYDRQLRLWGANGQRALADTTVLLVRATAAGTETLKNLVLPGVGRILIVDDVVMSSGEQQDSNFFTPPSLENKPRAQVALEHLQELNPDVQGEWKHVPSLLHWDGLLAATSSSKKTLVICADLEPPLLEKVSDTCAQHALPLVAVESYGLIGYVRLQSPPLALQEPKPENEPPDLRLVTPFAKLQQLASSVHWSGLDDAQHSHVPYPLILLSAKDDYKALHGTLPSTFAEKQAFRQLILEKSRNFDMELNFQEAAQNAYLAYTERTLDPDHLAHLLNITSPQVCPTLHVLLQALREFVQVHQRVPLQGTLPDMTSSTSEYVELQRLYHDQAAADVAALHTLAGGPSVVSNEQVTVFCKNCTSLDVLVARTMAQEISQTPPPALQDDWKMALMDPTDVPAHTPLLWYIALRACRLFYKNEGRYPGVLQDYDTDVPVVQELIGTVVEHMGLGDVELVRSTFATSDVAQEMVRYAQAELHTVASVVGGVASQEAVKVITQQYVPLNNTYIYNGIASTGGVYEF